jgi:septal ring factor EnvC (AmiA/AmiB activator)
MQQQAMLSSLCMRLQSELHQMTQQLQASQAREAALAQDLQEARQLIQAYAATTQQQKVLLVRLVRAQAQAGGCSPPTG